MNSAAGKPQRRRISVFGLALLLPWFVVAKAAFAPIRDNSFLWHIRAGELQKEAGAVLTSDPFSFTRHGEPWITQSWLAELLYSWGEDLFAFGFVVPMVLACSTVGFIGIGLIAYRISSSIPATAVVLLLSVWLMAAFLVPRPVIFSFPLFVLVILAWEHRPIRWTLPFLFWIWASVHGSFALGLVWVGVSLIAERDWRSLRVAMISGVATLFTAHGLGVLSMLLDFAGASEYLALISEWATPNLISLSLLPYLAGFLVLLYGAMKGRLRPGALWVIGPFLALGLTAIRAVPPAWLGLIPFVASSLQGERILRTKGFALPIGAGIGVLVVAVPLLILAGPIELEEGRFPVDAAEVMEDVPTFHDDVSGGYIIWRYGPERLIFIDDRAEFFKERIREYADVRDGRDSWRTLFQRDEIEQVLLRVGQPLARDLLTHGWRVTYRDDNYVLLRPSAQAEQSAR